MNLEYARWLESQALCTVVKDLDGGEPECAAYHDGKLEGEKRVLGNGQQ